MAILWLVKFVHSRLVDEKVNFEPCRVGNVWDSFSFIICLFCMFHSEDVEQHIKPD